MYPLSEPTATRTLASGCQRHWPPTDATSTTRSPGRGGARTIPTAYRPAAVWNRTRSPTE